MANDYTFANPTDRLNRDFGLSDKCHPKFGQNDISVLSNYCTSLGKWCTFAVRIIGHLSTKNLAEFNLNMSSGKSVHCGELLWNFNYGWWMVCMKT